MNLNGFLGEHFQHRGDVYGKVASRLVTQAIVHIPGYDIAEAVIAGVTDSIPVDVQLIWVGLHGAVVPGVGHTVIVDILVAGVAGSVRVQIRLIGIGNRRAVVFGVFRGSGEIEDAVAVQIVEASSGLAKWAVVFCVGDVVSVDVRIAGVADAVRIFIALVWVPDIRTIVSSVEVIVAIDVVVANVSQSVAIDVALVWVGKERAVVAGIAAAVASFMNIAFQLIFVGVERAVVLVVRDAVVVPVMGVLVADEWTIGGCDRPGQGQGCESGEKTCIGEFANEMMERERLHGAADNRGERVD
jgi:hypothetical protein